MISKLSRSKSIIAGSLLVLLIVVLGYAGWQWLSMPNEPKVKTSNVVSYGVGEDIILDKNTSFRVEQVQLSKAAPNVQPPDGMEWVNVQVTFETSTQPGVSIGNYAKYLQDASGKQYHYTETDITEAYADVSNDKFDLPLEGPATRTGWLGFVAPRHTKGLELVFKPQKLSDRTLVVPLNIEAN